MKIEQKPTKAGVKAALISLGYTLEAGIFPPALKDVVPAESFTPEDYRWAKYLIYDTDFGGAWDDAAQINLHLC